MSIKLVPPEPMFGGTGPPPASTFGCSWSYGRFDSAITRVAGELDISTTPRLRQTLRACLLQARRVVLDLHEVEFIDSSGVHAIVDAGVRARQEGRRLVLVRVPAHVHRVFALSESLHEVEIGANPVELALETPMQPRIRGDRLMSSETRLRAAADPVSAEHEPYDRLVRAIVDTGSAGEHERATSVPEDRGPR
jgi:anti-anti-sigma factor